jgi:6-phosphogluconolactonase
MTEPAVVVVTDPAAAAESAADLVAEHLSRAVAARGRADWATTGGSTAPALYRALTALDRQALVDWRAVHTWWGDERFVPRGDADSNVTPFDEVLAPGVDIDPARVHPFPATEAIATGRDPAWAAAAIDAALRDEDLEIREGVPVLEVIVLGMGPDGHILSVFPGSEAFDADAWAVAVPAPTHIGPHVARMTLHPELVRQARAVLVVANGEAKAVTLATVLGPERDERRWPAQVARHPRATWIVDEAAARDLPR